MIYFDACYIAKFGRAEPDRPSVIAFTKGNSKLNLTHRPDQSLTKSRNSVSLRSLTAQ